MPEFTDRECYCVRRLQNMWVENMLLNMHVQTFYCRYKPHFANKIKIYMIKSYNRVTFGLSIKTEKT